jgi:hypothetical protein
MDNFKFSLNSGFKETSATIKFNKKSVFERYKEEEERYCFDELISLYKAVSKKERDIAKRNLTFKRAQFMKVFESVSRNK